MTLFTEGRLQAYERMMQDTRRNYHREKTESNTGKTFTTGKQPEVKAAGKNRERYGCVSG